MTYDKTNGAVRGASKAKKYELLRLAFAKHISIAGGGSRLQKHCEQALRELGEKEIFSYSNATINSGRVYEALGFESKTIDDGQPFVIMEDYSIVRLITLHPYSTDYYLAKANRFKTHIGGNKLWIKHL
jgi:N-acetylglutamate synthase-like GNAT family acetyltransferase